MIRVFITAVWLCMATIAGSSAALYLAPDPGSQEEAAVAEVREEHYTETELTAVPIIKGNEISGYFLARMGYVFDASKVSGINIPIDMLLEDLYLSYAYNNENIDITNSNNIDIIKFSDQLVEYINERLGADVVISNLILQIDYRRIKEVRTSIMEAH